MQDLPNVPQNVPQQYFSGVPQDIPVPETSNIPTPSDTQPHPQPHALGPLPEILNTEAELGNTGQRLHVGGVPSKNPNLSDTNYNSGLPEKNSNLNKVSPNKV